MHRDACVSREYSAVLLPNHRIPWPSLRGVVTSFSDSQFSVDYTNSFYSPRGPEERRLQQKADVFTFTLISTSPSIPVDQAADGENWLQCAPTRFSISQTAGGQQQSR
jgi:hypothetical protein